MLNARGETTTAPTETIVNAIRAAHITNTIPTRDQDGRPGLALFDNDRLQLVLTEAEAEAVSDFLTTQQLENEMENT